MLHKAALSLRQKHGIGRLSASRSDFTAQLRRMTGSNSLLSESDVGRLALHNYLLSNDPQYVRQMTNGNSNA
jgi:hypothetical protein